MMKKINILSILIAVFAMISCTDTETANFNDLTPTNVADITLSISAGNTVTAEGVDIPFTITLPATYSSTASVQATIDYIGGKVSTSIDIPAGETSGSGLIAMTGDDGFAKFSGTPITLSATAFVLDAPGAGNASVFNATSNEVNLTSYDEVQFDYGDGVVSGRMTALFDWGNPGANDLDMLMFNADTFDNVESAASGSRYETDIFNDTHPDGNYFVAIDFWIASGDIPWKIFFVHPDQETITSFEGTFVGAASGDFIFPLINFTKSTDAVSGEVSYTFSQP